MAANELKILDSARWSRLHWNVFASTSLGFFAWGFVYSISTLISSWPIVPTGLVPLLLTLTPVFLLIGNLLLGSLSDRFGRRPTFMLTVLIYTIGIAGIIFSQDFYTLLFFVAIAQLGVGGEEPPALSSLAEITPPRKRGSAIVLSSNFYNIGAFFAALLSFYGLSSLELQKTYLGIAAIILVLLILFTRRNLPESVRWLIKKGKKREAEQILSSINSGTEQLEKAEVKRERYSAKLAFVFLVIIGISQLTTYGLLAFIIGPYSFPSIVPQIIMVANAGASVSGFVAAFLVDRIKRKSFTLFSYLGGLITVILVLFSVGIVSSNVFVFYLFLFLNMMFSELGWAARVVLEPELAYSTGIRATFIALIRVVAWAFYIISIYLTSSLSTFEFVELNVILWLIGAFASFVWFAKGTETMQESLESIVGEKLE